MSIPRRLGRGAALLALAAAGCGGGAPRPEAPRDPSSMPIAGLEPVGLGDTVVDVQGAFGTAEPEGDDLWVEEATIEQRAASVGFHFEGGALRGATVSFGEACGELEAVAAGLDVRLGERASAEPGVAAWSHAGWDVALYCHGDPTMRWLRLDVRPSAAL